MDLVRQLQLAIKTSKKLVLEEALNPPYNQASIGSTVFMMIYWLHLNLSNELIFYMKPYWDHFVGIVINIACH